MSTSGDNVMEANAQNQVPNKKQDDFDMVKLKKSLKQEQKRSSKQKVAKLTPAEIRSLNHGAGFSESVSPSVRTSEQHSRHGLASGTPPLTPDARSLSTNSIHQPHQDTRPSATLPTPPQSPSQDRRGSNASSRQVIHAPKPMSGTQVAHLTNSSHPSRTPSASSYRGVATYRGPEVTRTGSLTMFAHPSPQIVANPLSQFSRPRQSTLTSQPSARANSETPSANNVAYSVNDTARHKSLGATSTDPLREHSPVRMSNSPVSMEDGKVPKKASSVLTQKKSASGHDGVRAAPVDTASRHTDSTEATTKQKLKWRKTFSGTLDPERESAPLRKEHRRRTFVKQIQCLHAISYDDTKPGPKPLMRNTLKDELPSVRTSMFIDDAQKEAARESEYGQHPAVRPFNTDGESSVPTTTETSPSSNNKGKEREMEIDTDSDQLSITSSVPSYSRCSCCGRVQKAGFESELSPVMENENIRTNFNFEVARTSVEGRSRLSVSYSHKFTPIIPMEVGNELKQARIEPMQQAPAPVRPSEPAQKIRGVVNKPGDVIASGSIPLAIMPRTRIDPRLSRFGSLHARKEDIEEQDEAQKKADSVRSMQVPHQLQRFGSLYGVRNEAQPPNSAQPIQSAYQAQQAKHYSMPNVHRPVRSSRLAYHEVVDHSPRHAPSIVENLRPETAMNSREPETEQSKNLNDEDDYPVDLSSFDGSFVHRSISRSATVPYNNSPPATSHAQNGYNVPRTYEQSTVSPASTQDVNPDHPYQMAKEPIGVALTTPSQSSESLPATRGDWPLPTQNSGATPNGDICSAQRPSTIVKIIPSAPISSSSSERSANGQLRLGDWILPESPQSAHATPSPAGLGPISPVAMGKRSVAAA